MKRAIFSTAITIIICLVFQGTAFSAAQGSASANIAQSGEIVGIVDFCGPQGANGTVVDIVGRSFSATLGGGGEFNLQYVPEDSYTLRISIPNQLVHILPDPVMVVKGQVTDIGIISICEDNDGDGFTPDVDPLVANGNDCNDNNPLINPDATEFCDSIDHDCDGIVDGLGCEICTDSDNDGFFAQAGCGTLVDCNDSDNTVRPNATEICDVVDNNCDGVIDEGFDLTSDPANCGSCSNACASGFCVNSACTDNDGDGFSVVDGDCNDNDLNIFPGATEICDGADNDCDGGVDEGTGGQACSTFQFGVCNTGSLLCQSGGLSCVRDIEPSSEQCGDSLDNDCDGLTDEFCGALGSSCNFNFECQSNFCIGFCL